MGGLPACLPACLVGVPLCHRRRRSLPARLQLCTRLPALCPATSRPPPQPPRHADGSFPHHIPNPEDKGAVEATRAAVLGAGADLGIMLDTDVDRSGVVDRAGNGARGGAGWRRGGVCGRGQGGVTRAAAA